MRQARGVIAASIARLFSGSAEAQPRTGKRIAFEALESRILLSADPLAAGTLVVIDGSLGDLSDQWSGSDVLVLDPERDGLEQIAEALAARPGEISELHIVSHGWNGSLALGSTVLDAASLGSHQAQLAAWAAALTADADILFYGCNLAADAAGIGFVEELSNLTGADIAASTDLTGAASLGGDWDLEYSTGSIEADTIAGAGDFVLATVNYNQATDTLTFTADAGQADAITITSFGTNQLRIVVGNGDEIVLTGDTGGLTLVGTNTLEINRATAPVLAFNLALEDQNDVVSLQNSQAGLGSVSIDGGLGSDTVTLNTTLLAGNLTLGTEAVTVTSGATVNVGANAISAAGSGVVFNAGATVTAATFSAGSISITAPVVNLNANTTVGTLSLSGTGILSGSGNVTLEGPGTSTWSAGSLAGGGDLIVGPEATLSISGTTTKSLNKDLVNNGTIDWTGGNIQTTGTVVATFTNNGDFNLNAGASGPNVMFGVGSGSMTLNNNGSIVHTLGITNFAGLATVNNAGTVEVAGGTLSFGNILGTHTGSFSGAGVLQFGGGTHTLTAASSVTTNNVSFSGGTANVEGVYNIAGTTLVSGGTANLRGTLTSLGNALNITSGTANLNGANATVTTFTQSGGLLSGTGDLTVTGATGLSGGTMTGPGSTITQGALTISGGIVLDAGRTLDVRGGANWTAGMIDLNASGAPGSGSIVNRAGSTFTTSANSVMVASFVDDADNGADALFTNEGTFRKTGGTGATALTTAFDNSGLVDVQVGTLNLSNGGTHSGSFSGAGTLQFGGGTHTLNAASSVTTNNVTFAAGDVTFGTTNVAGEYNITGTTRVEGGTANFTGTVTSLGAALNMTGGTANFDGSNATVATFTQDGGVLSGTGSLTVTGATSLTSGMMTGSGSTITLGALTIGGDIVLDGGRTLDVQGGASWTAGLIGATAGTIINRATSTFTTSADETFIGADAHFINEGTFRKTGGTGSTALTNLENTGTVQVLAGVLEAAGSTLVQAGTIDLANDATFRRLGGFTNSSAGTLSGNGTFDVGGIGNTLTNEGVIAPGTTLEFNGDLVLTGSSEIEFDIAGTQAGEYDFIDVGGMVSIDGDVSISHVGGFEPIAGDSFLMIEAAFRDGQFDSIASPEGFEYAADYNEDSVTFHLATNQVPEALEDSYSTAEDTVLTIAGPGVLGNDVDMDLDELTAQVVVGPSHGTLELNSDGSFTYTPDANYFGSDSFEYSANDGQGGTDTATVFLTVDPVNDAPDAVNDSVTTDEDVAVIIPVRANDTDVEGDSLTVTGVTQGANGAVAINGDGTLTYTPNANFFGDDTFTYTVSDGQGGIDTATVSVTVNPVNDAPVAAGDSFTTNEDTALTVTMPGVLGNDTDVDSATLNAVLETGPTNGTLTFNADGSFTYTPNLNFNGTDSFTYRASDGTLSHAGLVTISVTAVNDAPDAVNDSVTTDEDVAVIVPVRANDADVEGDALTVIDVTQGANGAVAINGDGTLTYTPNANFFGDDTFTYTVSDGQGGIDTATVSVTVNPVNDAPVAAGDSFTTNEDTALTVSMPGVLGNDTDIDSTLTAVLETGPAHGTLTLNTDGSFTYTPNANYFGSDGFTYLASDGSLSHLATVSLTVTAVNDAPVAVDDSYATSEDAALTIDLPGVLGNDTDLDSATLTAAVETGPANGTLTLNADGSFTYTPNLDFNGTDSFTYRASDGVLDDIGLVTITVGGANNAPVAGDDTYTTDEDVALTVTVPGVLANDTDIDSATLTAALVAGPANGTLTLNADGSFTYTPNANFFGSDSFTYRASDGSLSDLATVSLTVNAVNDAPVAQEDAYEVPEDGVLEVDAPGVLGNDSDVDGDVLIAELVDGFDVAHGVLTLNADGSFSYTPDVNFSGIDTFTYSVGDGESTASVTIFVLADNDPPEAVDDSATTAEDTSINVDVLANDEDVEGDDLTVIGFSQGAHGTVSRNSDGTLTYTPGLNFHGTDSFQYTLGSDEFTDTGVVTITVTPVNDAPVAGDDVATTSQDAAVAVAVLTNDQDVDGDSLVVGSVTQGANGMVVINADGTVTYTPNAGFSGSDSFEYTVSDGRGGSDTGEVTVTVDAASGNEAPEFVEVADQTIQEGHELRFSVSATDADDPAGSLIYSVTSGLPAGATFNAATREFVWVPADEEGNQITTVTFEVLDPEGVTDTMEVVLTATNVAPTVNAGADQVVGMQKVKHDDDHRRFSKGLWHDHHRRGEATVDITASFNDLGTLDTHTATINWGDGTRPTAGTVSEAPFGPPGSTAGADGTVTGTHTYKKAGVYTVTVTVTDDDGAVHTDTLTVTVKDPNRLLKGGDDSYKLREDSVLRVDAAHGVLANDRAPGGVPLEARLIEGPDHGELTFNADGSFVYRPNANFHGDDSFWYEFTDGVNVSQAIEVELKVKSDGRRETRIDWTGSGGWLGGHLGGAKYANFVEFLVTLARKLD